MNRLFDTLEICLQELEKGRDVETILSRYPDLADELRPILVTAIRARSMSAPLPSTDAERRGRARVMQRAAQLREEKIAPRASIRVIPVFQRLALSFALLLILMLSGTGILSASASALPGESLYPVKRGWEGMRLFLIFDQEARELLANEFENERLHEVNELLSEGRYETIQIAGVFMQVNGKSYISGLQVVLPANIYAPENGAAVVASGRTNAQGFVEITSLELLPAGSVVPAGSPIEVESESDSNNEPKAKPASDTGSANGVQPTQPAYYEFQGTLQSMSTATLIVSDMTVYLDNSLIKDELCIGMTVEVKGYYAEDGRFIVTEVEGKGSCATGNNGSQDSNSNDTPNSNDDNGSGGGGENNDNEDSGNNDNSNDDDHEEDDDNGNDSGGGGGDDNDDD